MSGWTNFRDGVTSSVATIAAFNPASTTLNAVGLGTLDPIGQGARAYLEGQNSGRNSNFGPLANRTSRSCCNPRPPYAHQTNCASQQPNHPSSTSSESSNTNETSTTENNPSKGLYDLIRKLNSSVNDVEKGLSPDAKEKLDSLDDKFQNAALKALKDPSKENIAEAMEAGKALSKELGNIAYDQDIKNNDGLAKTTEAKNEIDQALEQLGKMADKAEQDGKIKDLKSSMEALGKLVDETEKDLPSEPKEKLDKLDKKFQAAAKKAMENPTKENIEDAIKLGNELKAELKGHADYADDRHDCPTNETNPAREAEKAADKAIDQLDGLKPHDCDDSDSTISVDKKNNTISIDSNKDGKTDYEITMEGKNSAFSVKNMETGESTRVWGDPHVDTGKGRFDFNETSTFVLPGVDGGPMTKITIDTKAKGDSRNVTYADTMTVTSGDNAIKVTGIADIDNEKMEIGKVTDDGQKVDDDTNDGQIFREGSSSSEGQGWQVLIDGSFTDIKNGEKWSKEEKEYEYNG